MESPGVVVVSDVVTDGDHRVTPSWPDDMVQIGFERVEETFDDGIVVAIPASAHTAADAVRRQLALIGGASVLRAAIGVMPPWRALAEREGAAPGGHHEARLELAVEGPA